MMLSGSSENQKRMWTMSSLLFSNGSLLSITVHLNTKHDKELLRNDLLFSSSLNFMKTWSHNNQMSFVFSSRQSCFMLLFCQKCCLKTTPHEKRNEQIKVRVHVACLSWTSKHKWSGRVEEVTETQGPM